MNSRKMTIGFVLKVLILSFYLVYCEKTEEKENIGSFELIDIPRDELLVHNRDKRDNHNEVHIHIHNHYSNDSNIDDDIDDQKEKKKRNKRRKKKKQRKCGPNDTRKKCTKQRTTTSNPTPQSDISTNSWVYTTSGDIYTHEVIASTPQERETPEGYTHRVTTISEKDIQYRKGEKVDKHVVRGD